MALPVSADLETGGLDGHLGSSLLRGGCALQSGTVVWAGTKLFLARWEQGQVLP